MDKKNKSGFLKVRCECGNEQVIFGKLSMEVKCTKCDAVLGQPTGGKAAIIAEIVETY
jgi:small subunit ribosomal protein S27e